MVRFSNFQDLDPGAADIARELVASGTRRDTAFSPFMNTWMGFNGWMESVTEADSDREMVRALADNRRLTDAYAEALEDPEFRGRVEAFAALWPVLNVRDVKRKLGQDVFWRLNSDELMDACVRAEVKSQPQGWNGEDTPTWPQMLRTIYLIRCNLFHGAKSPQNGRDRRLVQLAHRVLQRFIDRSGCLSWHD